MTKKIKDIIQISVFSFLCLGIGTHFFVSAKQIEPDDNPDKSLKNSETAVFQEESSHLKATVELGNKYISTKDGKAYLMLTLEGDRVEKESDERPPLNVSIVVDRSGSMEGQKLDYVKEALYQLPDLLDEKDRISVVVYDDYVDTVYQSRYFEPREFDSAIEGIISGGSTYLEGGLVEGIENVKFAFDRGEENEDYLNRVILLSDGLANVGVSDPYRLASIVEENTGSEITVSTIGVGADYDERLMTEVAKSGKGNYYFLEDPRDAERIFSDEFNSIINTIAKDIHVEFNFRDEYEVISGIGYELRSKDSFQPHDIYSGKKNSYLFEIEGSDIEKYKNNENSLGTLNISFINPEDSKENEINIPIKIHGTIEEIDALANDNVYAEYIKSYQAEELLKVYEDLDSYRNDDARGRMEELINELNLANSRLEGALDDEVSKLEDKRYFLEDLEEEYVNEAESGRIFQKSNQADAIQSTLK